MLPIFPLSGVVLLPRGRLPLNIFEPRYLAMVEDALSGDRMIGMIQPTDPAARCRQPAVYETGCAGRITAFTEAGDGRCMVTLTGVSRFVVMKELPVTRGYRRVIPSWDRFAEDLRECGGSDLDRLRLFAGLRTYFKTQGIQADWEAIEATSDERLITSLAMICPFESSEKQALLEAPDISERARLLIVLIEMAVLDNGDPVARH